MYLEKLKIHNFRRFEDLEINFHPRMTVIVGANGIGKTTTLEAAAVTVGTFFNPFGNLSSTGFDPNGDPRRIPFEKGSVVDSQKQFPVEAEAYGTIGERNITWKRVLNSEKGRTTIKEASQLISVGKKYQKRLQNGDDDLILPIIAYYGTGRLWDYHKEKSSNVFKTNTRTNGYITCLDGTANVKLMMNWFAKMTVTRYQRFELGEGDTPELDVVYDAMAACLKSATNYENIRFRYDMTSNELVVYYTNDGKKDKMPLSLMSDGFKGTISLIADIAYRMIVLNPQLGRRALEETDGIVLIDEIDLHLHPAWQQKILGDLQRIFPKVQFIVTTHAPAVIQTADKENICVLKASTAKTAQIDTYGKDANSILETIMDADRRPANVKNLFASFYRALDLGEYTTAENVLNELQDTLGSNDPELAACEIKLDLAQI